MNMINNSPSFTSNIRFVDKPVYKMMKKNNYIGFRHDTFNILKAPEFYSEEIRTCTGGGLVNPFCEAEGFHFLDDMVNKKQFNKLINSLFRFVKTPQRGLLVGSKDLPGYPFSVKQFERFKKVFIERVPNVSFFEKHKYVNSETNYHYSLENDTWTLLSDFIVPGRQKKIYVKSVDDLKKCFENIKIAAGDRLFIGKKEILPQDYPELFCEYS